MKYLKMLKLFDQDNTLSLSNLAMIVVLAKLATASNLDWSVLTAFFVVMLNHNARKVFTKLKTDKEDAATAQVETDKSELDWIKGELKALTQIINLRK